MGFYRTYFIALIIVYSIYTFILSIIWQYYNTPKDLSIWTRIKISANFIVMYPAMLFALILSGLTS